MDTIIYGADSETLHGEPMTLQFYSEDTKCDDIFFVTAKTATKKFLQWCDKRMARCAHVIYCHNLDFDLPEFLWDVKHELVAVTGGAFDFTAGDWHIYGVYGSPTFCRMHHAKKKISITIVDSFLWYKGSLAKAAEMFCPELPKLKRPKDLGERKFTPKDTGFVDYAMRDAEVAYWIGKSVQDIHREFDIKQAVSLADMSAKIFRTHFLDYTIPQPKRDVIYAALQSYHGGKNNVLPGSFPMWHMDVSCFDISSAYPFAMHTLPAFSDAKLYKRMPKKNGKPRGGVPPYGVYQVTGSIKECPYPILYDHQFKPLHGTFRNVWVHGLELNEAMRMGEVRIKTIRGFYYDADKDNQVPALRNFVEDFYGRKSKEQDDRLRYMYKIVLNSLYGKFIQTRKTGKYAYTDIDTMETSETHELVAGGMFHPFIASTITAHTREYIHKLEHASEAIHTATDGVFTYRKRVPRIADYPGKGLGSLVCEARGDLLMIRNKCYIMYADDGFMPSQYFKGKRIKKYALHGFQGRVYDLEKLVAHNRRKYSVARPNRLRESLKRGLAVNKFETRDYVLKVGSIGVAK